MSDTVIKVENLSKQYRLGTVGTGTLSHDLNRIWASITGKEDPYLQIGENNDRLSKSNSDYVWALKDVNFEVKQGDVYGFVGRNGAGKSTLLKILSQITRPTTGSVKMKGRVGSLLEVGTGFHQDLTGRENIYINGAILGMKRWEINKRLDEIIDFAGVERYIDTPVKRYSSGMMVRLGFAVAAHLEPEILIVDEVLAVGDVEFQKKCLGKMGEVSRNEGRTILFVSHNMSAIETLCSKVMLLEQGRSVFDGSASAGITKYLERNSINKTGATLEDYRRDKSVSRIIEMQDLHFVQEKITYGSEDELQIKIVVKAKQKVENFVVMFGLYNSTSNVVGTYFCNEKFNIEKDESKELTMTLKSLNLAPGKYHFGVGVGGHDVERTSQYYDAVWEVLNFEVKNDTGLSKWWPGWGSIRFRHITVKES